MAHQRSCAFGVAVEYVVEFRTRRSKFNDGTLGLAKLPYRHRQQELEAHHQQQTIDALLREFSQAVAFLLRRQRIV